MLSLSSPNPEWQCTSCGSTNFSDKETSTCSNCYALESATNLHRARALYLLGNICKESTALIPLKETYLVYPLGAPRVTYTKQTSRDGTTVEFAVHISDIKGIEKYHIEKVKFDVENQETFVVDSVSPYHNTFTHHFNRMQYNGRYSLGVCVKIYGSNVVSPTKTMQIDLSHAPLPNAFCNQIQQSNQMMQTNLTNVQNVNAFSSISNHLVQNQTTNIKNIVVNQTFNVEQPRQTTPPSDDAIVSIILSQLDVDDVVRVQVKDFDALKVVQLKEECRRYGFYVSGTKADLLYRLKHPFKYIDDLKRAYHTKKYGNSKRFLKRNYIWKNGNVVAIS